MRGSCVLLVVIIGFSFAFSDAVKDTSRQADKVQGKYCWNQCHRGGACGYCGKNAAGDTNWCCRQHYSGCPWNWGGLWDHTCNTAPLPPPPPHPRLTYNSLIYDTRTLTRHFGTFNGNIVEGEFYLDHGHARVAHNCKVHVKVWAKKNALNYYDTNFCSLESPAALEIKVDVESRGPDNAHCQRLTTWAAATLKAATMGIEYHQDSLNWNQIWSHFGHHGPANELIKRMAGRGCTGSLSILHARSLIHTSARCFVCFKYWCLPTQVTIVVQWTSGWNRAISVLKILLT